MEYQKIINLLDNAPTNQPSTINHQLDNQPSKFRTKNWVEKSDEACRTYNKNDQIKLKASMLKSSLCNYCGAYIF